MLNIAASWDPELAGEWGQAMGEEFWGKGTNIQVRTDQWLDDAPHSKRCAALKWSDFGAEH